MKKKTIVKLLVLLLFCVTFLPTLVGAFYALPSADDFSNAVNYRQYVDKSGGFFAPFYGTFVTYMSWQGTYFSEFVDELFRPYSRGGLLCLRLYLVLIIVGLIFAILYFSHVLFEDRIRTIFQFCALYFFFCICTGGELFYWYTGVSTYTLPLITGLLGCAWYIQSQKGRTTRWMVIMAALFGFFTSGSTLQITAIVCCAYMMIWFSGYEQGIDRRWIKRGIPFFITVLGAFINVAAPGNFARHELVSESYSVISVIVWTAVESARQTLGLLSNSVLPFFLVILFVVSICHWEGHILQLKQMICRTFFSLLMIPLNIFPVCLGYHQPNLGAERNYYICRVCICIVLAYLVILWGQYLGSYLKLQMRREELFLFGMVCVLIVAQTGILKKYYDGTSGRVWIQLRTGELQDCEEKWHMVLEELENSSGGDVVIKDMTIPETILKTPGLTNDSGHWVNVCISEYYSVDSIVIE